MGCCNRTYSFRRWLIIEQNVSAPIHLQIDESGREPYAVRQYTHGDLPRQSRLRHDLSNVGAVYDHSCTLVHNGAVENMIGYDGMEGRLHYLVRVIFCRCRGRSTFVPRHCATRMTSP